ncbi:MAG TPA: hypothetical protein VH855_14490 [Acetobacteraceae bacterium]|jgi:hypothetical protein
MLTLSHLANLMALLFGDRPETMQLVARNLRQARLVASGGRGRGGARQQPVHVANMIIAACAANQVLEAAGMVSTFANLEVVPLPPAVSRRRMRAGETGQTMPRELLFATRSNARFGPVVAELVKMAADGRLYSLLMSYVADFVDRDLLRAGADAIKRAPPGKKPEATAELAARMAAHVQTLIDQSAVYLKIGFLRPLPGAEIEFGTRQAGEPTALLRIEFGLPASFVANPRNAPKLNGWRRMDRSHRATITHRTLLSIGQAIAAEEGI